MQGVLKAERDPMGHAMLAFQRGALAAEVKVYPDFGEPDVIPVSWLMRTWEEWPRLEQFAVKRCEGSVLDIGAGAGSHALALQERGLAVTAIDISPGAVEVMHSRGVKDPRLTNIYTFEGERFDSILMMMNGIGIAGTIMGLRQLLQYMKLLLRPGGQIILDSSDIAYMYREGGAPVPLWKEESQYYGAVSFYMAYEQYVGDVFPWLYIDKDLFEQIALEEGYDFECLYEDNHFQYLARLSEKTELGS